ncbi:hypothetical protein BS50DRAFT_674706 [Corynespora cassiicola Philippines]|uniref:MFS general substrate transporter n=1 Tax=Corynespora cassiicola Philippines TaxID=1448308 RepID=A0A2T2NXZ3_CORCC|nr:hypothetical protein BS50DRAFT_674706 [Corynespora cassiicola Philippines]
MTFSRYRTAWGCGALLIIMSLGQALFKTPLLRIIEFNLCRAYYLSRNPRIVGPDEDLNEEMCKVISIQKDLATVNAYNITISSLIEIMTAFPYASLCGRFNRRSILTANVIGTSTAFSYTMCICYFDAAFDIRLIWVQSMWRLFGGGDGVLLSFANALIAESLPPENLSKVLFPLNAIRLFVNAGGQTLGARLMQKNLWMPGLIGLSVHCLAVPALCLIVDPRYQKQDAVAVARAPEDVTEPLIGEGTRKTQDKDKKMWAQMWASAAGAIRAIPMLCRNPTTALTLIIFLVNELGHGVNNIVQQWSSRSFSWTLAHTNYFLAGQRVVAGTALIGFSGAVHRLQKAGLASARLDLGLVWLCQWLTLLGMMGAAISWVSRADGTRAMIFVGSVLVYMMGWGMNGALQSSVTRVMERDDITILYTGLNVAERMAGMVSGPMFAGLLAEGMERGGVWEYLPFWVSPGDE